MNLSELKELFVQVGAKQLYAKPLSENDNSKNQVYFGPGFQALNLFPNEGITPDNTGAKPIFKAKLRFGWLGLNASIAEAPGAQLILYPQYPEVRFSGFLKGCKAPPSPLMAGRASGRILFLGVTSDRRVIGFAVSADSEIASAFRLLALDAPIGVFFELSLPALAAGGASRTLLLQELGRIHRLEWIESKQLGSDGQFKPCLAAQCGGFTLEAELGIAKNSSGEPDFLGWEVKQYSVDDFSRIESTKPITLLTPEPTGGYYKEKGVEAFVRKFGYPDKNNVPDRLNFGGRHFVGSRCIPTGLTMQLEGYDASKGSIINAEGSIALISDEGEIAALWSFKKVLEHWSDKHMKAVYVPSQVRKLPSRQYRYGGKVRLAEKTDALLLLRAMASGAVYYDPGIKVENCSTDKPSNKRRSQFRVASKNIGALYQSVESVSV